MSDKQLVLSTVSDSSLDFESEYETICQAVMETRRGRWFLSEYARRNRNDDTRLLLQAIGRIEARLRGEEPPQSLDRFVTAITEMAQAIAGMKRDIMALKLGGALPDGFDAGSIELEQITAGADRATADIVGAAERIQELAWAMRDQGLDQSLCDVLDTSALEIYAGCEFQVRVGLRSDKAIQALRYIENRISALADVWGAVTGAAPPAHSDAPQAERSGNGHDYLEDIDARAAAVPGSTGEDRWDTADDHAAAMAEDAGLVRYSTTDVSPFGPDGPSANAETARPAWPEDMSESSDMSVSPEESTPAVARLAPDLAHGDAATVSSREAEDALRAPFEPGASSAPSEGAAMAAVAAKLHRMTTEIWGEALSAPPVVPSPSGLEHNAISEPRAEEDDDSDRIDNDAAEPGLRSPLEPTAPPSEGVRDFPFEPEPVVTAWSSMAEPAIERTAIVMVEEMKEPRPAAPLPSNHFDHTAAPAHLDNPSPPDDLPPEPHVSTPDPTTAQAALAPSADVEAPALSPLPATERAAPPAWTDAPPTTGGPRGWSTSDDPLTALARLTDEEKIAVFG